MKKGNMDLILGTLLKSLELIQCLRVEWLNSTKAIHFFYLNKKI